MIDFDETRKDGAYLSQKIGEIIAFLQKESSVPVIDYPRSPEMENRLKRLTVDTSKIPGWSNAVSPQDEDVPVGTVEEHSETFVRVKDLRGWKLVRRDELGVYSGHDNAPEDGARVPPPETDSAGPPQEGTG